MKVELHHRLRSHAENNGQKLTLKNSQHFLNLMPTRHSVFLVDTMNADLRTQDEHLNPEAFLATVSELLVAALPFSQHQHKIFSQLVVLLTTGIDFRRIVEHMY